MNSYFWFSIGGLSVIVVYFLAMRLLVNHFKRQSKEDLDKIKEELVSLFIKVNKSSINVDGRIVSYSHQENDKIVVSSADKV